MLFDVSPDHGRSHSFTHRANEVTCPPQLPGPKLSFKVIKSFKHQPGADALEYPHRLSYRTLRRNLNVEMDMILVYFYRLDIHAIFDGRPPQELLAVFSLMWERHHPLAIFRRPDDVILAFKNGVTASMKSHRSPISRRRAWNLSGEWGFAPFNPRLYPTRASRGALRRERQTLPQFGKKTPVFLVTANDRENLLHRGGIGEIGVHDFDYSRVLHLDDDLSSVLRS